MKSFLQNWEKMRSSPVAILGAGKSGLGAASLLNRLQWENETYDEQGRVFTEDLARKCSFVVFSPGFKLIHPWIQMARNLGKEVIAEMDLGAAFCKDKIVAITGTNGKTTLTTLLSHIWNINGRLSQVAGNIGNPLTSVVANSSEEETTIFLETSSFQAQGLKILRPDVVIWNNFEPDHLDHHISMTEYFYAKANIITQMNPDGKLWIGESVVNFASQINYQFPYAYSRIDGSSFCSNTVPPDHFLSSFPQKENLAFAKTISKASGIDESVFFDSIKSYEPEPFRLSKIAKVGKASFWNDSKATNSSAVISAFKNFSNKILWIGGGREKGERVDLWINEVKKYVAQAFLIGEVAPKIHSMLRSESVDSEVCESLGDAIKSAYSRTVDTIDIVFSPGFLSYDMFEDYLDRGNSFNKLVFDLKKRSTQTTQ